MIPYHPSGSHSLHEAVEALAPLHHAILLRQHGLIVAGADLSTAMGIVEEVEQCCQIAVATALKGAPLTETQLQAIDAALGRAWTAQSSRP
jgi:ribulose-5-phosphate 4-epimerase/fuculose-1-phosphate aldolase